MRNDVKVVRGLAVAVVALFLVGGAAFAADGFLRTPSGIDQTGVSPRETAEPAETAEPTEAAEDHGGHDAADDNSGPGSTNSGTGSTGSGSGSAEDHSGSGGGNSGPGGDDGSGHDAGDDHGGSGGGGDDH